MLEEAQRVLLIGKTKAVLKYSQTRANTVVVLHGATALIEASGFSVVSVEIDKHSKSRSILKDHAVVR